MTFSSPQMQICYVLYPGDESIEGKTLRLKQQYTLCSASLQDIIARFERRSGASVNWEEFPEKVAVQMNDTHPTLCIPELMRILIDIKGLSWKDAWNITKRYLVFICFCLNCIVFLFILRGVGVGSPFISCLYRI
jgi:starch phosphorylase